MSALSAIRAAAEKVRAAVQRDHRAGDAPASAVGRRRRIRAHRTDPHQISEDDFEN